MFNNIDELCYYAIDNYVLCYYITMIMINAVAVSDTAYESQWYRMTRADQVIVEMIIRRAQRPYEIKGLGVFVCSLETYIRVNQGEFQQSSGMCATRCDCLFVVFLPSLLAMAL